MESGTEIRKASVMEFHIDLKYEFCAPHFFNFCVGETEEEAAAAERWFTGAIGHLPSPLVGKVKSVQELSTGCSLEEYLEVQKLVARVTPELSKMMEVDTSSVRDAATRAAEGSLLKKDIDLSHKEIGATSVAELRSGISNEASKEEPCTPKEQFPQCFAELQSIKAPANTGRQIPSKWNHSELQKQDVSKNIQTLAPSQLPAAKRCFPGSQKVGLGDEKHAAKKQKLEGGHSSQVLNGKTPQAAASLTISQQFRLNAEKYACKRQKLEGGRFFQVMHTKTPRAAPSLTVPHEFHFHTEKRAHIHKETGQCHLEAQAQSSSLPYIPVAEMVQRFQMNILGEFKRQENTAISRKRSLRLTHPKEPMLGTSLRARPPSVKSFAEQEEEMLAKLPKFKARPLNKRILEAPTMLPPPRSTPQLPEFQEFHLKTMERALMHQHPSTIASTVIDGREQLCLHRADLNLERPPRIKSSREMEQELAMMPKFKARPLDKRIFTSRGDVGVYTVPKRQATVPKEFQFATDQRAHQHDALMTMQRNQEHLQHSRFERTVLAKGAGVHSVNSQLLDCPAVASTLFLKDNDENQNLIDSTKLYGFGLQQTPYEANNYISGSLHPERIRKPLGEIQQHFGLGQAVQQTKVQKNDNDPLSFSHERGGAMYPPQSQESENFPVKIRATREFTQHLTPGRITERQEQKSPFPIYFMR